MWSKKSMVKATKIGFMILLIVALFFAISEISSIRADDAKIIITKEDCKNKTCLEGNNSLNISYQMINVGDRKYTSFCVFDPDTIEANSYIEYYTIWEEDVPDCKDTTEINKTDGSFIQDCSKTKKETKAGWKELKEDVTLSKNSGLYLSFTSGNCHIPFEFKYDGSDLSSSVIISPSLIKNYFHFTSDKKAVDVVPSIKIGASSFNMSKMAWLNQTDGFSVASVGASLTQGITTNGSDWWILDIGDNFIYHLDRNKNNLSDGFKFVNVGLGAGRGLCYNGSGLISGDDDDNYVEVFSLTGAVVGGRFPIANAGTNTFWINGIGCNGSDIWVPEGHFGGQIIHFSGSGVNQSDGFKTGVSGCTNPAGPLFNNSDYFVPCNDEDFMYHFDKTGANVTDGFSLGIVTTPTDLTVDSGSVDYNIGTFTNFWITTQTDFILHFASPTPNNAPFIQNITITPTSAYTNSTLNCSANVGDAEGDKTNVTIQWYNGSAGTNYFSDILLQNVNSGDLVSFELRTFINGQAENMSDGFSTTLFAGAQSSGSLTYGATTNGTDFWFVDSEDDFVYHVKPDGNGGITNYTDGFSISGIGAQNAYGITTNGSDFWITDGSDIFVYHVSRTGGNMSDGFTLLFNKVGANQPSGITTNGTDFWITDNTDGFVYHVKPDGVGGVTNYTDGFSTLTLKSDTPFTIATNGSDFWIGDTTDDFVYHINKTGGNMSDGFKVNGFGSSIIQSITSNILSYDSSRWDVPTDFWFSDYTDKFVYHIKGESSIQSKGETWNCTINATDANGGASAFNSTTRTISNTLPEITTNVVLNLTYATELTKQINCSFNHSDADTETLTDNFRWYKNNVYTGNTTSWITNANFGANDVLICEGWVSDTEPENSSIVNSTGLTITAFDYNISACRNITQSGTYKLNKSITDSIDPDVCINISVSNVEIDCIGWNNWIDGSDTNDTIGIKSSGLSGAELTNVSIKNCNLTDWGTGGSTGCGGISYVYTENSTLKNISLSSNSFGIYTSFGSNFFNITDISLFSNADSGIRFNLLKNSNIFNVNSSFNAGTGIYSYNFNNVTISNSYFYDNVGGIYLYNPNQGNKIINCTIKNNKGTAGIYFQTGRFNNITNNTIANNSVGIKIHTLGETTNVSYNRFWNNIINNTPNGGLNYETAGINYTNYFNTTKTAGTNIIGGSWIAGNYWSDYTGISSDGDYIGDTPYVINATYMNDSLPLVLTETNAPFIQNISITPNPTFGNSTLNCSANYGDANSDKGNVTVYWYNGSTLYKYVTYLNLVTGQMVSNSTIAGLQASGETWNCTINATDSGATASALNSTTRDITNYPSWQDIPTITPSTAYGNSTYLNCSTIVYDIDTSDTLTVNFTWYNGSAGTVYYNSSTFSKTNGNSVSHILNGSVAVQAKGETWNCTVFVNDGTINSNKTSITKTISNTAPSAPTDLSGQPANLYVGDTLTMTGSGSTDIDESVTYYYKFLNFNDSTEVQAYSTDNSYTIQATDTHNIIQIYTKSYDGTAYSPEYTENDTVDNTAPTIPNSGSPTDPSYVTTDMTMTCSGSTDADGDSLTYYYKFENLNDTVVRQAYGTDNSYVVAQADAHNTFNVSCKAYDSALYSGERNVTRYISNTVGTKPTTLTLTNPIYVGNTLTASGSGSTDADGDTLTYYYVFYNLNDSTEVQAYSTTATYTIAITDAHNEIRVRTKAHDTYDYSLEFEANRSVTNTAPTTTSVTLTPDSNVYKTTVGVNCTINGASDADGDTLTKKYHWYLNDVASVITQNMTNVTYNKTNVTICMGWVTDGNPSNSTLTNTSSVTILNSIPSVPQLAGQANNTRTTGNSVTIKCENSTDADTDIINYAKYGATSVNPTAVLENDTSTDYTWTTADGSTYYWRCKAEDGATGSSAYTPQNTFTENTKPTIVQAINPTANTTDILNCSANFTDAESDKINATFIWYNSSVFYSSKTINNLLVAYTNSSYNLTAGIQADGETWNCSVNAFDGYENGTVTNSSVTIYTNNLPFINNITITPATAYTNSTLNCSANVGDADSDKINATIRWYNGATLNGSVTILNLISGQMVSNSTIAGIIIEGETWNCTINATDSFGAEGAYNSTTRLISNSIPLIPTSLTLTNPVYVTDTLTASGSGSTDIDEGDSLTYYYQFYNVNDSSEVQAYGTDNTYVIAISDAHNLIRVRTKSYDGTAYSPELEANRSVSNTAPATPTAGGFTNASIRTGNSVTLSCSSTDADGDTLTYDMFFDTNNPPATSVQNTTGTTKVMATTDGSVYYYRCKATDANSASAYTAINTFSENTKVALSNMVWKTTGGFTAYTLAYNQVLDYINATATEADSFNNIVNVSIKVTNPDGTVIVNNINMTNGSSTLFTYTPDITLNRAGNWTINTTANDGYELTSIASNISVSINNLSARDGWFGYSYSNVSSDNEIINLVQYGYDLIELSVNSSGLIANWSNITNAINTSYNNNMRVGLNILLDYDYTSVTAQNNTLFYINSTLNNTLLDPYSITIAYISFETISATNAVSTLNNVSKEAVTATSNKFPVYSRNFNSSSLDSSYISYTKLLYIDNNNSYLDWIEAEKNYLRTQTSLNRIYIRANSSVMSKSSWYQTNILDLLRGTPTVVALTNPLVAEINGDRDDLVVFNNRSTEQNLTVNVSDMAGVSGKDIWDATNKSILAIDSTNLTFKINVSAYSASLVFFDDLDHIQMTSNNTATLYKASTPSAKHFNYTDNTNDGSWSMSGSADIMIELFDPYYTLNNFVTYYGWINASYINIKEWENYSVVIIADISSENLTNLNYTATDFYGYVSVADYDNGDPDTWLTAEKLEVDAWITANESMNIFIDGLDYGVGGSNFVPYMKNLVDYIKITKGKKLILNTYTYYETFATWGDGIMKESCVNRWNTCSESGCDYTKITNYSREVWSLEVNRSQWFQSHGLDVYCLAFNNRTTDTFIVYNYTELQDIYYASKVLGYQYFYLAQPDFNYVMKEYVKDVGTDLSNSYSTDDDETYYRRYSKGIVYYNSSSGKGWFDDGRQVTNVTVCFNLYDEYVGTKNWNFFVVSDVGEALDNMLTIPDNAIEGQGVWNWECKEIPSTEYSQNGRYIIGAWVDEHVTTPAQGLSLAFTIQNATGKHSYYDSAIGTWTWSSPVWNVYGMGQNWMIDIFINETSKTSLDTLPSITQDTSTVNLKANITITSVKSFPLEVWSTILRFFSLSRFVDLTYWDGTSMQKIYPQNSTDCDTNSPTFNITNIAGEDMKACYFVNSSGVYVRVAPPSLSTRIYQLTGNNPPSTPQIGGFVDSSRTIGNSLTLVCENSTDSDGDTLYYAMYYDTNADPTTLVQNTTGTTYATTPSDGLTYYFKCKSQDGYETSAFTSIISHTENTKPTISLTTPLNNTRQTGNGGTLTATGSDDESDTIYYEFYYGTTPVIVQNTTGNTYAYTSTDGLQYYWWVKAGDGYETAVTSNWTFLENTIPPKVIMTSPINDSRTIGNSQNIQWNSSTDAEGDTVYYELLADTSNPPTTSRQNTTGTSYALASVDGSVYYTRIKVQDGYETVLGVISTFTENTQPTLPTAGGFTDGSRRTGNSVTLSCSGSTDAQSDTLYYAMYYDTNADPTTLVQNTTGTTLAQTPTDGLTYYYKCKAQDNYETSSFTSITSFTENTIPVVSSVNITSDDNTKNTTIVNLTRQYAFSDAESDVETDKEVLWYNNSHLVKYLSNYTTIMYGNTTRDENWTLSIKVYDGYEWSGYSNSTNFTILNTAPLSVILYNNNTITLNTIPTFNWSKSSDADNDAISYILEIYNDTTMLPQNRSLQKTTSQNYTLDILENLTDGKHYWRVLATDNTTNSSWTQNFEITIDTTSPVISISSPTDSQILSGTAPALVIVTYSFSDSLTDASYCYYNVSVGSLSGTAIFKTDTVITNCKASTSFSFLVTGEKTGDDYYRIDMWGNNSVGLTNSISRKFLFDDTSGGSTGGTTGGGGGGLVYKTIIQQIQNATEQSELEKQLAKCGDGICQDFETPFAPTYCSVDCAVNFDTIFSGAAWEKSWFVTIVWALLGIFIVFAIAIQTQKAKIKSKKVRNFTFFNKKRRK